MPAVIIRKVTDQDCQDAIDAILTGLGADDRHGAHLIAADPDESWDRRRRARRLMRWEHLLALTCDHCLNHPTA